MSSENEPRQIVQSVDQSGPSGPATESGNGSSPSRASLILVFAVAIVLAAGCDRSDTEQVETTLDSTGATIERGVEKVGDKIDTAVTGIRTALDESQIQGVLDELKGMENVEAELQSNGDVTLVGSVATEGDRRMAEEVVRKAKGVRDVVNALKVGDRAPSNLDTGSGRGTTP